MPRPDKQINSRGPLYAPVSSARTVVWKKRTGHETVEASDEPSGSIEFTIDDLTVSIRPALNPGAASPLDETSKWTQRPTSAQLPLANQEAIEAAVGSGVRREPQRTRTEWVVTRTIEGRSYRRTDVLTTVHEHSGA